MDGPPGNTAEERADSFGARLRRARETAGLAQEELAARAGLSPNVVGGLERGEHRHPYPATVRALAAALGLTDAERATLAASVPRRGQPATDTNVALPGLPAPLSSLVGREREVAEICSLLRRDDVRLVTLTGPGGVGKTRLALQVAADLAGEFAHGAAFVSLAAVRDPALVGPTIAHVLGVVEGGGRAPVDRLGDALRARHLLLVLDNYEQVLDAAPLVTDLLARCPRLTVLATSRTLLRLDGERVFPVPPLAVPDPERRLVVEQVIDVAAVRLFVDRARDADPAFALTDRNAGAVAAVCHRLDGLPLAIELAAARTTLLAPDAMLPRLARRLPLLTGGRRDAPDRHRTMRDAIAWSHDLLSPAEQTLFQRLAAFVDGWTLEAAEHVGRGLDPSVLDLLSSLVDKSLVRAPIDRAGEGRYEMLETIREYGEERLVESGEETATRTAHAAYFLALAERIDPPLSGPPSLTGLAALEREQANCRAALAWFAQTGDAERLLRLAAALGFSWEVTGHWADGTAWLERALAADPRPSPARAAVLRSLGTSTGYLGDYARAETALREALSLIRQMGAAEVACDVLGLLGSQLVDQARYDEGEATLAEALAEARRIGDRESEASALAHFGVAAWGRGDAVEATARLEAARALGQTVEDPAPAAVAARYLAHIAIAAGDCPLAAERLREVARVRAGTLGRLVPDVAALAAACGDPQRASRLLGAAASLAEVTGLVAAWPERALHERAAAMAETALGGAAFAAAFEDGRRLPEDQVLAEVAAALDAATAEPSTVVAPGLTQEAGLTRRELDVLRLLVEGRSNMEIADALFVSVRTARAHVASILAKLGVPTRTAAATHAVRHGLL